MSLPLDFTVILNQEYGTVPWGSGKSLSPIYYFKYLSLLKSMRRDYRDNGSELEYTEILDQEQLEEIPAFIVIEVENLKNKKKSYPFRRPLGMYGPIFQQTCID